MILSLLFSITTSSSATELTTLALLSLSVGETALEFVTQGPLYYSAIQLGGLRIVKTDNLCLENWALELN